jgi:hypothetical protein
VPQDSSLILSPLQSALSAAIGSTLAARRAGIQQASKATAASMTTMPPKVSGSLEDCFRGKAAVIRKILQTQPAQFEVLLAKLGRDVKQDIEELKPSLASAVASLGPASDTIQRKLLHRVASLETKFVNFEMRRNLDLNREVTQLLNSCYPHGNLQERELGIHCLLTRLGPSLLDTLYESMDTRTFAHRLVYL